MRTMHVQTTFYVSIEPEVGCSNALGKATPTHELVTCFRIGQIILLQKV
jgi:hypothetical protein